MSIEDSNYYGDYRVAAANKTKWYDSINTSEMTVEVTLYGDDDDARLLRDEVVVDVPFIYAVCPTCEGKGEHVNPSIDAGGISGSDFAEDPDFYRQYRQGVYDVLCYECGGLRVVPELDRGLTDPAIVHAIDRKAEDDAEYEALVRAERRMGA